MVCYNRILNIRLFFSVSLYLVLISNAFAQLPTGYIASEVQNGYNTIMGVVFNSDGTKMFVWEKRGHVYVSNWNGTQYVKQTTPVLDISDEVGDWRDFGFASFCLDPNFDTNGLVYMYYMVDREHLMNYGTPSYDPNDNDYYEATISRLTRYQLNIGSNPLTTNYNTRTVLLGESVSTGVPLTHESHAGGTVIFANDGTLLVSTGDNASYSSTDTGSASETYWQQAINDGIMRPEENVGAFRSQMITSLCGKVLRLDPATGDGIPSNPHYNASNPRAPESRMWAMGLRHPFRMSIQPNSGSTNPADGNPGIIQVADVGWGTWEDLHIFDKAGLNGGWPLYEGLTQHNGYYNSGTTNPDEGNVPFVNNCPQPTNFVDDSNPALRRFVHDRPEVAWRHGGSNEARVPWFNGTTPTNPRVGTSGSPTTGIQFRGNTAIAGVYITGDAMGSSMTGKYLFTDYVRNWINIATLTDGTLNWISDISELAPINFGDGIVHMMQNPLDGFIYYVNIYNGTLFKISFEGPTWTNQPTDVTLQCDQITDPTVEFNNWLASVTGTVLCGNVTLTNDNSGLSISCGASVSETVTFTLADDCGNEITKQATFTIEDNGDPTFNETLPASTTVECDNIPTAETLTASDTCGIATVSFTESTASGSCSGDYTITRTWTATDECNNETIHIQTITVEDNGDPTFNEPLPASTTVECDNIPTAETLTASDTCGIATVSFTESTASGSCSGDYTITRTWTATDECNNETIHIQTITVEDNGDPTFNEPLPASTTVECDNIPTAETLTASDTCGIPTVSFTESTASGSCSGDYTITRTWTATDECNNETIHIQTITVEDNGDPTFNEPLPASTTVECDNIPTAETLTASDTCGIATVSFNESTTSGSCSGDYTITRTWTATDECNNETIHIQTITVEDNGDPTFNETLPASTTVECDAIPTAETLTASDTCGIATVSFTESTASGSCSGDYTIIRTWTATDECNNETIHIQTITVEDNGDPTFNEPLPASTTVECDNIPTAETLTASDTCGMATVSFTESTALGSCAGDYTITRTWTATDECNNETVHIQTITVEDNGDPTFNEPLPASTAVECDAIPTAETLTASDTCGIATVSFTESTALGSCAGDYTITRTWTATDECNNETIHIQTITVEDNGDPTFNEPLPASTTVECDNIPTAETLTASDTCGIATVSFTESTALGSCAGDYTITRTWTATDECNNETIHIQTITVEDNGDPTFNEPLPASTAVECDAIPTAETLTASDTCGTAMVSFNESIASGSCSGDYTITRTWTATDECNNETIHIQTITVEDNGDPTFNEPLPASTTVECDNIPTAETLTASDTCGIATMSFNESTASGSCSGDYTITRTWTATDECNNETIHIQTITVEDNVSPIWNVMPSDMTIMCSPNMQADYEAWLNSFSGTDNCGTPAVIHNAPATVSCPDAIEVIFELTDVCGNTDVATATFNVESTLHVSEVFENDIVIFPNPTDKHIYIKGLVGESQMEVYNIAGQNVFSKMVSNGNRIEFNLESGLYLVRISSDIKSVIKKLIIR
ncbi:HYR-like domain-containing protein [Psychroserpens mesophilus]|uniref:HYR-like domain-containing protein n=2 Tax=Psychroserpens mesophilus TaxID=325473 RepID=UPI0013641789|nr:PQQ-dependent sugar dehydrogenase [Psychroserpens mesophilus]